MEFLIVGLIVVAAALVVAGVIMYNSLVNLRNKVQEGWAQIDVQLKRRADLIPNLVNTVKGYATHEASVFEEVTRARAAVQNASGPQDSAIADKGLSGALGHLFAVAENYPQLQASTNFLQLQEELTTTENKVAFSRQYYNNTVRQFNTKIQTVPTNIVANFGKFDEAEYFEVQDEAVREAPTVQF